MGFGTKIDYAHAGKVVRSADLDGMYPVQYPRAR